MERLAAVWLLCSRLSAALAVWATEFLADLSANMAGVLSVLPHILATVAFLYACRSLAARQRGRAAATAEVEGPAEGPVPPGGARERIMSTAFAAVLHLAVAFGFVTVCRSHAASVERRASVAGYRAVLAALSESAPLPLDAAGGGAAAEPGGTAARRRWGRRYRGAGAVHVGAHLTYPNGKVLLSALTVPIQFVGTLPISFVNPCSLI